MKIVFVLLMAVMSLGARAQVSVSAGRDALPIVAGGGVAPVVYDGSGPVLMEKVAGLFADDVERVTGRRPETQELAKAGKARAAVMVGIVGGKLATSLERSGKADFSSLKGKWECYSIRRIRRPAKGIGEALVVIGSDRRGAAYGLLSVSRAIGVSPWYFWLDAPVAKRKSLSLSVKAYDSKTPSVKYRGIFINDEDWGLYKWASQTYEKDRGNFGPRTYAAVCELLLRLNANYLCPAMHNCSKAFYQVAEDKLVADSFGIVMGTSHCEPLFLNTATEWKKQYGDYDFVTNRRMMDSVMTARVRETAPYEGVYTLALRGLHDVAMKGSNDLDERKDVMQRALESQRQILADVLKKPANEIPQAFTPYKEVLDVYDHGLKLPDDVTIIWPDDNYGYLKRLSSPKEQKRSGRSGVYYHSSYLGRPHNYLWMNTTSPTLMYEELYKAYHATADRIWLLNAGDIKLCEPAVDFFLSMAYDLDSFNYERAASWRGEWTARMIGNKYANELDDIFTTFYDLAFQRKPEMMGWGSQWTNDAKGREINTDTEFSLTNYREAERRLAAYRRIADETETIYRQLPQAAKACFYEAVVYPVKGCELMNRAVLDAQRNRWYACQDRAATDYWAKRSATAFDSLETITKDYNALLGGKWNHVVQMKQSSASAYFDKPELRTVSLADGAKMGINVEGEDVLLAKSSYHELPSFSKYLSETNYYIDIFNQGKKGFGWKASADAAWIKLSQKSGRIDSEQRLFVSVDWDKAPQGVRVAGAINITADNGQAERVLVSLFNPASPSAQELDSAFVETNGYISIPATGYYKKQENNIMKISNVPNIGCEGEGVLFGEGNDPILYTSRKDAAYVEYKFYSFSQGLVDIYSYVLPTFAISGDRGFAGHERTNIETHYGLMIDPDTRILEASTSSFEYAQHWYESVMRNCRINKTTLWVSRPGWHTLRVIGGDGGTLLQKLVLDFGGMKRSYMGPQPTRATANGNR